jgi:transcriptional regulator with XRE-family HTH domain
MENFDLKKEIKKLGLTQKEFAQIVGIHTNTITQWINGTRKMPEWIINFIKYYKKAKILDEIDKKLQELKGEG